MKILITGSKGQLGNALRAAAGRFPQLSLIAVDVDELNITNRSDVLEFIALHRPGFIINAAAYTAVDKAEDERPQAGLVNAVAVGHLVAGALPVGAYLLHVSTDYVFDGKKHTPYLETDLVNPLSVYGQTKLEGEQAALSYKRGIVVRTAWLYSATGANFLTTMLRLGATRKELKVVNDQFGSPTSAGSLADALLQIVAQIADTPQRFTHGIFHYTNAGVCSWYDFARQIMEKSTSPCHVLPCTTAEYPAKAHRPAYSVLNCDKIKNTYGITPPHWQEALDDVMKNEILKS
ncbi:MAG: dTDP-4-dehydrorhamnose reductase [Prevotellaceae bacterium]|jgi:dTDP-4-dehydrorhamnose reductase|nr:dTDP-4-dehydrorhamnose reductase [Prevotellaceae bacterium]